MQIWAQILILGLGLSLANMTRAKAAKSCEEKPSFSVELVTGERSAHLAKTQQGRVNVGGAEEQIPEGVDRLAIQRVILSCTPGLLKCHQAETKQPKKLRISFSLSPVGETAKAGDWILSAKGTLEPALTQCLIKVLNEAHFGLTLPKAVQMVTSLEFQ